VNGRGGIRGCNLVGGIGSLGETRTFAAPNNVSTVARPNETTLATTIAANELVETKFWMLN
jgi:hypothetical protein